MEWKLLWVPPGRDKIKELLPLNGIRNSRTMSWRWHYAWAHFQRQLRLLSRHARHGRASFAGAPSARKAAELGTLFAVVNAFLRDLQIDYALAYGTLLGWHRERRILPHDRDIDFATPVANYRAVWDARSRLPSGFTMHDTSHRHRGPKLYVDYRNWDADIYFFEEKDGHLASLENCINPGDIAPFPRAYFFPVQRAEFLGQNTFVPAQPEALLLHHYGYLGADGERDPVTRYFRPRRIPSSD